MRESKMDKWVQTLSLTAMVALALSLLGVGLVLYAPPIEAATPDAPAILSDEGPARP